MGSKRRLLAPGLALAAALTMLSIRVHSQDRSAQIGDSNKQFRATIQKAVEFLRLHGQSDDGSFSATTGVGPTALVATGLLSVGVSPDDPMVDKALKYLERHAREDGGIYASGSRHQNYDTCIAMAAFAKANRNGVYDRRIKAAEQFIKRIQWDETEGKDPSDTFYGGAGYGSKARPDLSNTSYMIEALREIGAGADDEAIQRALVFVSRCQNLESPANRTAAAALVNDGGFYYTPANGGESFAGKDASGGLRSYGSMTYAGLKSMIHAGLDKDDQRVKAAVSFLRKNYGLQSNPGMGSSGLFYYYHTLSKALHVFGEPNFSDASGQNHDWKAELREKIASLQQPNGSWVNSDTRWMEGDPNLVTAYALMALANCKP